ncbi:aminomethyltransferase family protein [Marinomonas colpomeniae]|uniref:Sarcosine oxidase subunit gamma n=1 Tax=Marinomonas colpomeniae TaxID=2774408 RepID=A0ABR8P0L2_9GAMM|nr:sarcosine oxidase subunit gamma [Marinomonas colpomeniae]MBD5771833.1 sarcosine oxidase subunit gamma [Marinomonas colpomeniae]
MAFFNLSAIPNARRSMVSEAAINLSPVITMGDISVSARVGFRGKGALNFLKENGFSAPDKPNQAKMTELGICILRLSNTEFWLIDSSNTNQSVIESLELASNGQDAVYRLYCQHSHGAFIVSGAPIADMFAKICAVDLNIDSFSEGAIAQTSVARVNAIIVRMEGDKSSTFLVLSDSATADYLWHSLADAASEFV